MLPKILAALLAQLHKIDPKALQVLVTGVVTYVVAHVGLDVDDPTVLLAIGVAVTFIVGVLIPNAGTGQTDRWAGDTIAEPAAPDL